MKRCQNFYLFSFLWVSPEEKNVSILNWWHCSGIYIIQLLRHCFLIAPLCLCDLWCHFRADTEAPKELGFPLTAILHCISSSASVWNTACGIQQQATSALCWSRYLHKEAEVNALSILPKAIQHTHGAAFTQSPKPHLRVGTSGATLLSQSHVVRQVAMSPWEQMVCRTRVSCCAKIPMGSQSKSFHPQLLLFTSVEGWKHTNGQATGIYDAMWAPACWSVY